jgi:(p)ppGpp synthase/HD superfamily hydrolase
MEPHMTPRYSQALALAAKAHEGQARKGTAIPYIVHPVGVAGLVAQYGGDEDQQIAALLHDVLEDGGPGFTAQVALFGERVLHMVMGCTDAMPTADGTKAPWEERKRTYLTHLMEANNDTLLVSGCDKLYNARAILEDLRTTGPAVFERFSAGQAGTLWYYGQLAHVFERRGVAIAAALRHTVSAMERLATA